MEEWPDYQDVYNIQNKPVNEITYLFWLKHMLVKILVKLFIGVVDTELLKGVPLEYFKPKNVQHSNTVALETHPNILSI